jgi:hypothetical protein
MMGSNPLRESVRGGPFQTMPTMQMSMIGEA